MTPISAIGFDKDRNMLILGDVFGNIELWSVDKLINRAVANKKILKDKVKKRNKNANESKFDPSVARL